MSVVLFNSSSSQVKDWRACNRLWFFRNVLRVKPPQTESQARGSTVHGALEAYLKAGVIDPKFVASAAELKISDETLQAYVQAIKPHFGKPGEGVTEYRDELPTFEGGPPYVVVIDHAREVTIEGIGTVPQIDDLKTTSDFRYCKTPAELAEDVQMVSYGRWALRLYEDKGLPPPDFVSLRHVYVRTRGAMATKTPGALVKPDVILDRWNKIVDVDVRAMVDVAASVEKFEDVPPDTSHCGAYGGCFFRPQCFGSVTLTSIFKKDDEPMSTTPENGTPHLSLADRVARASGVPISIPAATDPAAPSAPTGRLRRVADAAPPAPAAAPAEVPAPAPSGRLRSAAANVPSAPASTPTPAPIVAPAVAPAAPDAAPSFAGLAVGRLRRAPAETVATPPPPEPEPAAQVDDDPAPTAGATVCGAQCSIAPSVLCTLPPHTGKHESRNAAGGVVNFDARGLFMGISDDWKALDGSVPIAAGPAVLPPDAPARTSTPEEVAVANAPKKRGRKPAAAAAPAEVVTPVVPPSEAPRVAGPGYTPNVITGAVETVGAAVPIVAAAPEQAPAPAAGGGRLRRADAPAASEVQVNPETGKITARAPAASAAVCPLVELFVDCWPVKGSEAPGIGEDLVALIAPDAAAAGNVPDYRFISYTSKAVLATALRARLAEVPRVLVVTSSAPGSDALLEVLAPYAKKMVRALRG